MLYTIRTAPLNTSEDNERLIAQCLFDSEGFHDETKIDILSMYVWRFKNYLPGIQTGTAMYSNLPTFTFSDETLRKASDEIAEQFKERS